MGNRKLLLVQSSLEYEVLRKRETMVNLSSSSDGEQANADEDEEEQQSSNISGDGESRSTEHAASPRAGSSGNEDADRNTNSRITDSARARYHEKMQRKRNLSELDKPRNSSPRRTQTPRKEWSAKFGTTVESTTVKNSPKSDGHQPLVVGETNVGADALMDQQVGDMNKTEVRNNATEQISTSDGAEGRVLLSADDQAQSSEEVMPATFLSRDASYRKPGAVRVRGLYGGDEESSLFDDAGDSSDGFRPDVVGEEEPVTELPGVLVAGVTQDNLELQRLREKLANVVDAQIMVEVEMGGDDTSHRNRGSSTENSARRAPDHVPARYKCGRKASMSLLVLGLFVALSGVAIGIVFLLQSFENGSPTHGPTAPTPSTVSPIATPTHAPTQTVMMPTVLPTPPVTTQVPTTEECLLEVNMPCNVTISNLENGTVKTATCIEAMSSGMGELYCASAPFRATFLYNGGSCDQSDVSEVSDYSCSDSETGPPPTMTGAQSYIIVTDSPAPRYDAFLYFRGHVSIGDFFPIESSGNGKLDNGIRIFIFRSDDLGDRANLLQELYYNDELCSTAGELTSHFGALQLSSYDNDEQGHIPSIVSTVVDASVSIEVGHLNTGSSAAVAIDALMVYSDIFDTSNFTDKVAGSLIQPGESISVDIPLELTVKDLRQANFWQVNTIGSKGEFGRTCVGQASYGWPPTPPPPPPPPALEPIPDPPTPSPSPPAPTTDPLQAACQTNAAITCEYRNPDDGDVLGDCENTIDPQSISCTNDFPATGLAFRYQGGSLLPSTAFIEASTSDGGNTFFSGLVNEGDTFRFDGAFQGKVAIKISSTTSSEADGVAAEEIETLFIDTTCQGGVEPSILTLTATFGPLELVGFENLFGYFSSILDVQVQYFVSNVGDHSMVAESATVASNFNANQIETITNELVIATDSPPLLAYEEAITVDFGEKFANGDTIVFAMTVSGRGEKSSISCSDTTSYSF